MKKQESEKKHNWYRRKKEEKQIVRIEELEKIMGEMLSHSYDIADRKFITPIATYVKN